jgi:DNA-3-methyladenine glycosylase
MQDANDAAMTSRSPARLSPLPRSFYLRDPRQVARDLLGKLLIRRLAPATEAAAFAAYPVAERPACEPGGRILLAGRIVEAEAYLGAIDPGAHSYRGQTPRNAVLFGPPGHAYVYFIYGNHYCTNVGCQPAGNAGCVLLRALEPVCGRETMSTLRSLTLPPNPRPSQLRLLTSGPGRLSQALAISREHDNAKDLCSSESDLLIADDGSPAPPCSATPRINVTSAPLDQWRFVITGNPFVSGKKLR